MISKRSSSLNIDSLQSLVSVMSRHHYIESSRYHRVAMTAPVGTFPKPHLSTYEPEILACYNNLQVLRGASCLFGG